MIDPSRLEYLEKEAAHAASMGRVDFPVAAMAGELAELIQAYQRERARLHSGPIWNTLIDAQTAIERTGLAAVIVCICTNDDEIATNITPFVSVYGPDFAEHLEKAAAAIRQQMRETAN